MPVSLEKPHATSDAEVLEHDTAGESLNKIEQVFATATPESLLEGLSQIATPEQLRDVASLLREAQDAAWVSNHENEPLSNAEIANYVANIKADVTDRRRALAAETDADIYTQATARVPGSEERFGTGEAGIAAVRREWNELNIMARAVAGVQRGLNQHKSLDDMLQEAEEVMMSDDGRIGEAAQTAYEVQYGLTPIAGEAYGELYAGGAATYALIEKLRDNPGAIRRELQDVSHE